MAKIYLRNMTATPVWVAPGVFVAPHGDAGEQYDNTVELEDSAIKPDNPHIRSAQFPEGQIVVLSQRPEKFEGNPVGAVNVLPDVPKIVESSMKLDPQGQPVATPQRARRES